MGPVIEPRCPACGSRQVGRIGASQYYCWECCIEFTLGRRETRLFKVDTEGTLQPLRDPEAPRDTYRPTLQPRPGRGPAGEGPGGTVTRREGGEGG